MEVTQENIIVEDWRLNFEAYYNAHFEQFIRYAYSITRDKQAAEDVVSEVFAVIWDRRQSLGSLSDLSAYIFISIKNLALKLKKKQQRGVELTEGLRIPVGSVPDPESILLGKELEGIIKMIFDQLSPHEKLVYDMARNKGMSHDEISKELGVTKHTTQKHLSNVLKAFRVRLSERFTCSERAYFYLSKLVKSLLFLLLFAYEA